MRKLNKLRNYYRLDYKLYSGKLGINLTSKKVKEAELFKWFLASILYGKRISEEIAARTYKEFVKAGLLTPKAIIKAGWNRLVEVLDKGGYVRYDFSTATKLLDVCKMLLEKYGSLTALHHAAKDSKDIETKLLEFKGIGPLTTNIFLRELRHVWKKANPELSPLAKIALERMKIKLPKNRKTLKFVKLEAGLTRAGKLFRRGKW